MKQANSQSPWDNQNIVLISADPSSLPNEVISRLERRQWLVTLTTPSIRAAIDALYNDQASFLMVHDTKELPVSFVLRAQLADPLALMTPTLVLCHESHQQEVALLKDMGLPDIVEAPINPAAFVNSFEWILRRWSSGAFQTIYQARRYCIEKNPNACAKALSEIPKEADTQGLITAALSKLLIQQNDLKSVEKMLLTSLKEQPKSLTIVLSLVDFYLQASMPETCLKILNATRKSHGNPNLLLPDIVQAHLMLNQVRQAIPLLEALVRADYGRKLAQSFLARCFYAEGYLERFQKVVENQIVTSDDFKSRWNKFAG